jgi:hypothetical protein
MAQLFSLIVYATDGSTIASRYHETRDSLQVDVLTTQSLIDRAQPDEDGKTACRFEVSGIEYNEWRGWIK